MSELLTVTQRLGAAALPRGSSPTSAGPQQLRNPPQSGLPQQYCTTTTTTSGTHPAGDEWGSVFEPGALKSGAHASLRQLPVTPVEIHYHSTAEHVVDGEGGEVWVGGDWVGGRVGWLGWGALAGGSEQGWSGAALSSLFCHGSTLRMPFQLS